MTRIEAIQADITTLDIDVVVNAAHSSLMGGGGVDGAIHRAGGPAIREECKVIVARQGPLPTGQAVITTAGNMPARHVIHTVGPVWGTAPEHEAISLLASCYRSSLDLAGEVGVAGYWGSVAGRDANSPGSWGLAKLPGGKPKRFSVSYHLLAIPDGRRVRLQVWCDDGEPVPSVVGVWPTADWHEREQYDLMGIAFEGHPNLVRILMDEDWEGHPLRKDYPIGGEPVRFSEEE